MKNHPNRRAIARRTAFSLAEVIVAVTVIAMMMVSFLSIVQFAGETWQRSRMTINLASEANLVLDFIEREIDQAYAVDIPAPGAVATHTLRYAKMVYDGVSMPMASFTFEIAWPYAWTNTATTTLLSRVLTGTDSRFSGSGWTAGVAQANNVLVTTRYNFELARHIASFTVHRTGSRKLTVGVQVKMPMDEDANETTLQFERVMFIR